jgi:hypothetical protein
MATERQWLREGTKTMTGRSGWNVIAEWAGFAIALNNAEESGVVNVFVTTVNDWSRSIGRKL